MEYVKRPDLCDMPSEMISSLRRLHKTVAHRYRQKQTIFEPYGCQQAVYLVTHESLSMFLWVSGTTPHIEPPKLILSTENTVGWSTQLHTVECPVLLSGSLVKLNSPT